MKQLLLLSFLTAAAVLSGALGDPGPDRFAKLEPRQMIPLVEQGQPRAVIVVEPASGKLSQFAARELQTFIKRATGAELPIAAAPVQDRAAIIVGSGELAKNAGIGVEKLPRDGFIIRSQGNKIFIAGRDEAQFAPDTDRQPWVSYYERATLFGVYSFLERFLGARLVFPGPGGEFVKKSPNLTIPSMDIYDRPDNIARAISWNHGWKSEIQNARINNARLRMQTDYIPNCHGLGRLGYIERFGEKHPEYFALRANGTRSNSLAERMGGQLCFSSGIREEIYQDAKAFLSGVSAKDRGVYVARFTKYTWDKNVAMPGYFNVMPQDGMTPCLCEKCQVEIAKNPDWSSDVVWQMTVDIAKRLKAEGVSGSVTQMAYGGAAKIPPFEIPSNIPVMVAVFGPWAELVPAMWAKQLKTVGDWTKKLNHKVWLWTYVCKYSGRNIADVPCTTPKSVARFYLEVQPQIFGGFMESESDRAAFQAFNWYIYGKIMWDKSLDGEKLLAETYRDLFGAGAPPMERFFGRLEEIWLKDICGSVVMTATGPEQIPPTANQLWNEIYGPEVLKGLAADIAAAEAAAAQAPEALARIKFWADEYLGSLRRGADKFTNDQKALSLLHTAIPEAAAPPALDGKLSDPAWAKAATLKLRGLKGAPTEVNTEVKLLRDVKNLYIGYRCEEPRGMEGALVRQLPHDDLSIWTDESAEIFLSPGDRRQYYYQFMVNPAGSFTDTKVAINGKRTHDVKYESGAVLKTFVDKNSWSFELAIPLSALDNAESFAADFTRSRVRKQNEPVTRYHTWSPFAGKYGDVENFGTISFAANASATGLLENSTFDAPLKGRAFGKWITSAENIANKWISLDPASFMFAGQSLKLSNDGSRNLHVVQMLTGKIKSGQKYRLRAFIRTEASGDNPRGGVFMQFNDGANRSFPNPGIKQTMPWTAYSFEFTAREGVEKAYLRLYSNNFNGDAWFDGATLEEL